MKCLRCESEMEYGGCLCGSNFVAGNEPIKINVGSTQLPVTFWVCKKCGYTEASVNTEDFSNAKRRFCRQEIFDDWSHR